MYRRVVAVIAVPVLAALPLLAAVGSLAACSSTTAGAGGADGGTADAAATSAATKPLSCLEIFACAEPCPASDDSCSQKCLDRGAPSSQTAVSGVVTCYQNMACADAACLQAKCSTELEACSADSTPKANGTPAQGDAPTGNVPAELVGSWVVASYGATNRYTFAADGTATSQIAITSTTGGCQVSNSATQRGTIQFTATEFSFFGQSASAERFECGTRSTGTETAKSSKGTWMLADGTLTIVDSLYCNPSYDTPESIAFYCTIRLQRE